MQQPRVAFFTDSFHEVNGVAQTSRQFDAFARRWQMPFLRVNAGTKSENSGPVQALELGRGAAAFRLEQDMRFDPLFMRHKGQVRRALENFRPDVVHVTGPSDVGILGATLAHEMKLPVVASWHTNLHEFGARRLQRALDFLPHKPISALARVAERAMLSVCAWYYTIGRVLLAPNQELIDMLHARTGKPVFLMRRGIDTNLFHPANRTRQDRSKLVLGYVGRITAEKGVRVLYDVERALFSAGIPDFEIHVVGHGAETEWLRQNMKRAVFPGVLKGQALAQAYANMDAFLFPSRTDTFGNVILEALASGVPAIVTDGGGPKFLVEDGRTGFITGTERAFTEAALRVALAPELLDGMRIHAREYAMRQSWDAVFNDVYSAYEKALVVPA